MKRSRSTYQPRESCPALRNRCPRKLKNSSNTSEPSRSTSSRDGRFSGARTCSVNVTYTVISHQPRVSKLAESGARHDLSIFWFVWQKSARPQNNARKKIWMVWELYQNRLHASFFFLSFSFFLLLFLKKIFGGNKFIDE